MMQPEGCGSICADNEAKQAMPFRIYKIDGGHYMDTNIKRKDRSVSVTDIFLSILQSWRMLIVFFVIFVVLLGLYGTYKNYKAAQSIPDTVTDSEGDVLVTSAKIDELKNAMTSDELTVADDLIATIKWYQQQLEYYRNYNNNSIYCAIDPDNINTVELQYFVGVSGLNEEEYSSVSTALVKTYMSALSGDSIYKEMIDNIDDSYTEVDYRDIITTDESKSENGIFKITIFGLNDDMAAKMADIVNKYIMAKADDAKQTYEDHEIKLLSREQYVAGNSAFREKQLTYMYALQDIEIYIPKLKTNLKLTDAQTEYVELLCKTEDADSEPEDVISDDAVTRAVSLRSTLNLKMGFLGGILGIVIAAILIIIRYIGSGRIHNSSDIENDFDLPVICSFADRTTPMRKHSTGFDRWITRIRQRNSATLEREKSVPVMAAKLESSACKDNLAKIVFVTDANVRADLTLIDAAAGRIGCGIEAVRTGNIVSDESALKAAEAADGIVIIVQSGLTRHNDIYNLREACHCLKGSIIGVVVAQ